MVVVLLNNIQFEAERFETRNMPTPDMKGKEVIYWIKVKTEDRRLASDLQRFLEGAPSFIELKVPSAFISTRTELETFRTFPQGESKQALARQGESETGTFSTGVAEGDSFRLEILLRRTLPESGRKQSQSPYG